MSNLPPPEKGLSNATWQEYTDRICAFLGAEKLEADLDKALEIATSEGATLLISYDAASSRIRIVSRLNVPLDFPEARRPALERHLLYLAADWSHALPATLFRPFEQADLYLAMTTAVASGFELLQARLDAFTNLAHYLNGSIREFPHEANASDSI